MPNTFSLPLGNLAFSLLPASPPSSQQMPVAPSSVCPTASTHCVSQTSPSPRTLSTQPSLPQTPQSYSVPWVPAPTHFFCFAAVTPSLLSLIPYLLHIPAGAQTPESGNLVTPLPCLKLSKALHIPGGRVTPTMQPVTVYRSRELVPCPSSLLLGTCHCILFGWHFLTPEESPKEHLSGLERWLSG